MHTTCGVHQRMDWNCTWHCSAVNDANHEANHVQRRTVQRRSYRDLTQSKAKGDWTDLILPLREAPSLPSSLPCPREHPLPPSLPPSLAYSIPPAIAGIMPSWHTSSPSSHGKHPAPPLPPPLHTAPPINLKQTTVCFYQCRWCSSQYKRAFFVSQPV
jgi:hypothetical protein